jgi:stearoyl-CoA desaturase (delta-9 desaturase)
MIVLGQSLMAERPALDLKTPLQLWNGTLSVLSFIGFVVNLGYLQEVTFETSYIQTAVDIKAKYGMVLMVFLLSKFVELSDTVFLVLRKKDVCFLHWFHHLTVLIYCWFSIHDPIGTGYWFAQTNMLVHAVMYAYFAFASELRGVSWFNPMWVTALQIGQMIWGLMISAVHLLHADCVYDQSTLIHAAYAIPMYASYLYLFCAFMDSKNYFQTPVNWSMCFYLLIAHVMGIQGVLRCTSWLLATEVIVWYQICALGITIGCHRLWSHRSFKACAPTRFVLMLLASIANQGGIYHWSRDHRVHHKESDRAGDPHDIGRGFFYAHMGWLLLKKPDAVKTSGKKIDCSDLLDDPFVRLQYKLNPVWDQVWCFVVPGIYGIWRLGSFWDGLLIFGVLRWILLLHATWCVNSVAHTFGYHPYNDKPPAENLFTSIVACGEGWHNFHHAFPFDYTTAEHPWWYCINTSTMVIDALSLVGQTYDHKRKVVRVKR